jgi:hypothetical protein
LLLFADGEAQAAAAEQARLLGSVEAGAAIHIKPTAFASGHKGTLA